MIDQYYLGFSYTPGIGAITFQKLLHTFETAEKAYLAPKKELIPVLGSKLTDQFIEFRSTFDHKKTIKSLKEKNIEFVAQNDSDYPAQLKTLFDPPIGLFIKGNRDVLLTPESKLFSIVGTRKATSYGRTVTEMLTRNLVDYDFVIVSGMALGIDSQAHETTLQAKGKTVAVLGCGVDIVYPPQNATLYKNILENNGLILSEFPPGQDVLKGLFVSRNRIVSGLSGATLIVEGDTKSGALITAKCALEQGKDVFAVPGPITSFLSWAPNMLIKQGAIAVTGIDDILQNYNITKQSNVALSAIDTFSGLEKNIVELLLKEPLSTDELTILLNIPVSEILQTVSTLEIKGIVRKTLEGSFMMK
jgi:DNA processing protein